jgi:hypothetical protein
MAPNLKRKSDSDSDEPTTARQRKKVKIADARTIAIQRVPKASMPAPTTQDAGATTMDSELDLCHSGIHVTPSRYEGSSWCD